MKAHIAACLFLILPASRFSQKEMNNSAAPTREPSCGQAIQCQKAAKAAFHAEMARVGKDCINVSNQRDENICEGEAAEATERNLTAFFTALEGIVGSVRLRDSQQAWLDYRKKQCDAVFDFWRPGTIAPSRELRCEIELTRSRMRDLDGLYETPLHH